MITHNIAIDYQKNTERNVIDVKQGDAMSRTLNISLYSGGVPYTIPETVTEAQVNYCKPDGTGGSYVEIDGATAVTWTDSTLTVKLARQMFTVRGNVPCEVRLFNSDGFSLGTFSFVFAVFGNPLDEVQSEDFYNNPTVEGLQEQIGDLANLHNPADTLVDAINNIVADQYNDVTDGYNEWVAEHLLTNVMEYISTLEDGSYKVVQPNLVTLADRVTVGGKTWMRIVEMDSMGNRTDSYYFDGVLQYSVDYDHDDGFRITNIADPISATDAAPRQWVLDQIAAAPSGGGKIRIDYEDGTFTVDGEAVNFKQIHDYLLVDQRFVFVVSGNRAYLPAAVDDTSTQKSIRFSSTLLNDGVAKTASFYITSNDGVEITNVQYTAINSENVSNKAAAITDGNKTSTVLYPSVKAVADFVAANTGFKEVQKSAFQDWLVFARTLPNGCYILTNPDIWTLGGMFIVRVKMGNDAYKSELTLAAYNNSDNATWVTLYDEDKPIFGMTRVGNMVRLSGIAAPESDYQAANKAYVDSTAVTDQHILEVVEAAYPAAEGVEF